MDSVFSVEKRDNDDELISYRLFSEEQTANEYAEHMAKELPMRKFVVVGKKLYNYNNW